tara:strand:- start:212 stop:523 length:312 start_codon:yes stop_codon:yes gene_type:complete
MGKTPVSWIELIKILIKERKSKGKPAGVSDVMDDCKKAWKEIKSGTHPKYIQGKPPKRKSGTRKNKQKKLSKMARKTRAKEIKEILKGCDMCKDCLKNVDKCL